MPHGLIARFSQNPNAIVHPFRAVAYSGGAIRNQKAANPIKGNAINMKISTRSVFKILVGAALAVMVFVGAGVMAILYASVGPTTGEYAIAGLEHPVEIRFDAQERPFVRANTFPDALAAQGWLHATHRLWQMDLFRRAGRGRLAALLGTGMIETDREMYRLGVPQLTKALEANASSEILTYVEAYVAGVNAALDSAAGAPPEYLLLQTTPDPWETADVFALGAVMVFQSANNFENELLRLALVDEIGPERAAVFIPDDGTREDFPYVFPTRDTTRAAKTVQVLERIAAATPGDTAFLPSFAFGSNGWVVAPERSDTGHALFAFDSHDAFGMPNLFYEVHLFFGEDRQIRGWSVPGLPGVINGYNERIAWGFTNIGDSQDLFLETRADGDPRRFKDGDTWYEPRTETYEIPVDGREAPDSVEVVYTRNGTLISEDPPISLRWTIQDLGDLGLNSLLELNLARNWEEFTTALDTLAGPPLNATYADVDGHIGFRTAGLLPVRGTGEGLLPLAGDDPANRWTGLVDMAELPEGLDPPEGFFAAANARLKPEGQGPLVSADNAPGYRIRRIQSVLSQNDRLGVADMKRLQLDWHDTQAELLLPTLLADVDTAELDAVETAALEALRAWAPEPVAQPEAGAALVFQAWYRHLAEVVFRDALGDEVFPELYKNNYPLNHALDRLILDDPDSDWWRNERGRLLRDAFVNAIGEIRTVQGATVAAWRLDTMHAFKSEHELGKAVPQIGWLFNAKQAPWGGSTSTVGRARYRYDRGYDITGGATVRVVGDMAAVPSMAAVIPGGQSGHPLSGHYSDQLNAWLEGEYFAIAASWDTVEGDTLRLTPRP